LEESPINARITGRLRTWSLDNHPEYQALSYTWGNSIYKDDVHQRQNQDLGDLEIRLDGHAHFVPRNLYEALLCLRKVDAPRCLWIDAICINQNDVEEQNHQVGLMRHIYTEAISVIAWLGPSDRHSSIFMQLVENTTLTDNRPFRRRLIRDELQNREYNFVATFHGIFRRSYWHRTWIIQEIYFARKISVQCGHKVISWKDLVEFLTFLTDEWDSMDKYHPWWGLISRDAMARAISYAMRFNILNILRKSRPRARRGGERQNGRLAHLLFNHWDALATNPRDKIFAIIGLASDSHLYSIDIDYRLSVSQVYTKFFREHVRLSRNLSIIIPRRLQDPAHNLPSWCPDLSSTISDTGSAFRDTYPFLTLGRPYHASTIDESGIDAEFTVHFSPCGQIMMVGGWKLGRVRDLSDVDSMRDFQPARKGLFDFSDLLQLCGRISSEAPSEPSETDVWYSFHRRALQRGFRDELRRHLVHKSRRSYRKYCVKKSDEFFRTLVRATTLEVDESVDTKFLLDLRAHRDIPGSIKQRPNENMEIGMRKVLMGRGQSNIHGGHKCFFVTRSGLMGLAPNGTQQNDIVCILRGCNMPVMLRRDGVHTRLLGVCYVAGFMHGQLHDYIRNSRIPVPEKIFNIC